MAVNVVKLSEIAQIESGGTPSSNNPIYWNGDVHWATLVDVKNKYVTSTKRKITDEGLKHSSAKLLPIGTVLFSSRATIGEVSIANVELATNQGFKNFICDPKKIIPEYLYFVLKFNAKKIADSVPSTTFKEISKTKLGDYKIPLPSITDQKLIVEKLSKAKILCEKREDAIKLLDSYLKSVFLEMFNKRNADWFTLKDVSNFIDYRGKTPVKTKSGIQLITAKNVKDGYLDFRPEEYIAEDNYDSWMRRGFPKKGDVLFTTEAPLGNTALLPSFDKLAFAQRIIIIQPKNVLTPEFLLFALNSNVVRDDIFRRSTGSTVKGIRSKELAKVKIPVPSLNKQLEFVRVFNSKQELKHKMITQLHELNKQYQALVHKAFNLKVLA